MESAYAATLPPRERRIAGRLEGFGDIVFGFAVSQCALQLPTIQGHVDFGRPVSLAAYFGTFAVLSSLWLTYHRVMSESFRPTGLDLFLAFAFLAFVSLMPFAMYSLSHQHQSIAAARAAVAEYALLFTILMLIGAIMTLRSLRRGWYFLNPSERDFSWRAFVRRVSLAFVLGIACAIDLIFGPVLSTFAFPFMGIVPRIVRLVFHRAPSPQRLRIPPQPIGTT